MRALAVLISGLGLVASVAPSGAVPMAPALPKTEPALTRVEYFCSPGFVPTYGGQCVATQARDEVELFVNEPAPPPVRHRRRHGLSERY